MQTTKPTVYVETSVVSYLAAWPSRDVVVAGHQQVTREWWLACRELFHVVCSALVMQEAETGDDVAAEARVAALRGITLLEVTSAARDLARSLVAAAAIPPSAAADAMHVAIAATNGIEYLATWNCRHLANATMRAKIEGVCRAAGYRPPLICTPEELLEVDTNEG